MKKKYLYYLAYGSNLHPLRLKLRTPSSEVVGVSELLGYGLRFNKHGRDGSGKCNVLQTNNPGESVIGVVYRMLAEEKPLLDQAEGLGRGYDLSAAEIAVSDVSYEAFFYVAQPAHINDALQPYTWYKQLVLDGARVHGLPDFYIDAIAKVAAVADPDAARHARHEAILHGTISGV